MPAVSGSRRHVVVDMTPLEPGGQNGGAGLVAVSLVRHLGILAPEWHFTLLTGQASHAELASLDAPNVRRTCVVAGERAPAYAGRLAKRFLPPGARRRLQRAYWCVRTSGKYARATDDAAPDLLFCPFTAPHFWRPGVACVCLVHDLQHVAYPAFFTSEQRASRQQHLTDAARKSDRLVCVSEYVRSTVLANLDARPESVQTIRHGLLHEGGDPDQAVLDTLGLATGQFLLYPANFWPHKNHRVLFEALRLARETQPESTLKLVCTGAPNALMHALASAAESILPAGTIVFAGYVPSEQLLALLDASAAVVFPSLYEGFGMPVLEAMARGRPVLASNVTSLPEVAGEAATYFDPTRPQEIARAIAVLQRNPALIADRVRLGRQRAAAFGGSSDMAARYLLLFRDVLSANVA